MTTYIITIKLQLNEGTYDENEAKAQRINQFVSDILRHHYSRQYHSQTLSKQDAWKT